MESTLRENERGKIRVLYIVPSAGLGGAETFVLHTAKYHSDKIEPIYCFFQKGPLWEQMSLLGVNMELSPVIPRLRSLKRIKETLSWLKEMVKEREIDIVHSTMAYGAIFGSLLCRGRQISHTWFQHGPVGSWLDRVAGLLPADLILTNSSHTLQAQKKMEGMSRKFFNHSRREQVIYLGVDFASIRTIDEVERVKFRKEWGIAENTLVIGHICRPQPQKGIELLIQSIHKANQDIGSQKIQGVLVGGVGEKSNEKMSPYEREMLELSQAKNRSVIFLGATREPLQWMQAMDVIVNTAVSPEGFGLTLIEGMAVGKVAIGPDEGGPKETIEHGKTGFLFKSRSCDDLAEYLTRLASDLNLLKQMGQSARRVAEERFDIQRVISELETQYQTLYGESE